MTTEEKTKQLNEVIEKIVLFVREIPLLIKEINDTRNRLDALEADKKPEPVSMDEFLGEDFDEWWDNNRHHASSVNSYEVAKAAYNAGRGKR